MQQTSEDQEEFSFTFSGRSSRWFGGQPSHPFMATLVELYVLSLNLTLSLGKTSLMTIV